MIDIKKKILTITLSMIFAIILSVNVLAVIIELPYPPKEVKKFVIIDDDELILFDYTNDVLVEENGTLRSTKNVCNKYVLVDNEYWEFEKKMGFGYPVKWCIYDSQGIFAPNDTIKFVIDAIEYEDFSNVIDKVKNQINVSTAIGTISIIVIAVVGLVFIWWAVKKLVQAIMIVFRKGKIKL